MSDPITVQVRLFASLRQAVGQATLRRTLPAGSTVGDLMRALAEEFPALPTAAGAIYASVNRAYAGHQVRLQDGDEVGLFPPVSGGQAEPKLFEVTEAPLSLDDVARRVAAPTRGAVTVFAGLVRGETDLASPYAAAPPAVQGDGQGRLHTDYLEYEAYPEMAEAMFAQIAAEVQARWPQVEAVSIVHRVGRIEVGEPSVVVAVAAAHRQGTFDACSYAIERLKAIAPIWKKEVGRDGQWWVEGPREANPASPVAGRPG
ncbi:MAG: molybdenum cofactor biosynthesis protein MoaE [Caldilineales bacterium]|nr:molybdenum cofactor biosynthesis protein MoaE [Caldilineales bacterium]MDW8317273.1 molybdenum cofactor biosynthesis protein MoaE [Anaerolineae bacterium]